MRSARGCDQSTGSRPGWTHHPCGTSAVTGDGEQDRPATESKRRKTRVETGDLKIPLLHGADAAVPAPDDQPKPVPHQTCTAASEGARQKVPMKPVSASSRAISPDPICLLPTVCQSAPDLSPACQCAPELCAKRWQGPRPDRDVPHASCLAVFNFANPIPCQGLPSSGGGAQIAAEGPGTARLAR